MKRVILIVAISTALCGVGLACGDDEPATTAPEPEPVAVPEPAPEPEPEAVPEPEPEPEPEETANMEGTGQDESELECEEEDVECPTFEWMEANTKAAVEEGDTEAMGKAFHKIEFMAPLESWNDVEEHGENAWNVISRRGALLSEADETREARRMCKACHEQWRDAFREHGIRTAAMVELPDNAEEGDPELELPEGMAPATE